VVVTRLNVKTETKRDKRDMEIGLLLLIERLSEGVK
jgi:hypothetical protein